MMSYSSASDDQDQSVCSASDPQMSQLPWALPSPDVLREYEAIVPGAANRIIELAELAEQERIQREIIAAKLTAMFKVEMALYLWMTYVPLALLLVTAIFIWAAMDTTTRVVLLFGSLTVSGISLSRQLLFKRKLGQILDGTTSLQLTGEQRGASPSSTRDSRNASTPKMG